MTDRLSGLLESISIAGVRLASRAISSDDVAGLLPEERAIVSGAVESRVEEFATGRRLLRSALSLDVAILRAPSGRPLLPRGVVASLAHDRDDAIVAVATEPSIAAIGVDIEPDATLGSEIRAIIVHDRDDVADTVEAFVAKEAVYKAWSSLGGEFLDHGDVTVRIDRDTLTAGVHGDERVFDGRMIRLDGRVVCVAWTGCGAPVSR